MSKPDVKFIKWRDPFGSDAEDELKTAMEQRIKKHNHNGDHFEDIDNMDSKPRYKEWEEENEPKDVQPPGRQIPILATSMGMLPLTEYTQPGKVFNFWVGHCTFDITDKVFNAIEATEGVEILTPLTRYRFRIGVGDLFDPGTVLRAIRKAAIDATRTYNAYSKKL